VIFSIFKKSKHTSTVQQKVQNLSNQNQNPKITSKPRLHVLGIDAEVDPVIGKKLKRGIYASDRIHSLVMGFPSCGKTRFLLSQIKQHIGNSAGFGVGLS
jgi:hypothetical protein